MINIYNIKMQEYHGKMFNYNEDFKNFIRKYTLIRKELNELDTQIKNKREEANNLINNQNVQIENNNFDMAEKIEEDIKANNDKIEELKTLIRQKNENELETVKLNLIQLIREKNDFYDSYLIIFEPLIDKADASLDQLKKEKDEELIKIKEEMNKIEVNKIKEIYNESVKNFKIIEKEINDKFEDETKDITENISKLNDKFKETENELEELKLKIKKKEEELSEIKNEIEIKNKEKQLLKVI